MSQTIKFLAENTDNYIVRKSIQEMSMQQYQMWPGAYSFNNELKMFLEYMQEQITIVLSNMEKTEHQTA